MTHCPWSLWFIVCVLKNLLEQSCLSRLNKVVTLKLVIFLIGFTWECIAIFVCNTCAFHSFFLPKDGAQTSNLSTAADSSAAIISPQSSTATKAPSVSSCNGEFLVNLLLETIFTSISLYISFHLCKFLSFFRTIERHESKRVSILLAEFQQNMIKFLCVNSL